MKILVGNRTSFAKPFTEKKLEIALAFTSQGSPLDRFASIKGIRTMYYLSKPDFLEKLRKINFSHLFSAGCPFIIPEDQLNEGHRIFVNVHPSFLPFFPGRYAITEALYAGGPFGVTVHTMDIEADAGHLIYRDEISIDPKLNTMQKYAEIFKFEEIVINRCLDLEILFKEKSHFQNLPRIYPKNSGFTRDRTFRKITHDLTKEEAERRILALSVTGHMSFIENKKKRYYISDCLEPGSPGSTNALNWILNYEFKNGNLLLIVASEEKIE